MEVLGLENFLLNGSSMVIGDILLITLAPKVCWRNKID